MANIIPVMYDLGLTHISKNASSNAALRGAGGVPWNQFDTKKDTATDPHKGTVDPNAGKIFREGRWWTPEEYHAYYYGPGGPGYTGGGTPAQTESYGGGTPAQTFSQVPVVPTYTPPAFNVPVPKFEWNPQEEQKAKWLEDARVKAGLIVDPQVEAVNQALQRYLAETGQQKVNYNKQYTDESLAIANIIKNTVKQGIIDNAIARGAETSGELQRQLGEAGRYEVEQRTGVENARNAILQQLANAELAKQQETSDSLTALEKLRGAQTESLLADLERAAQEQYFKNIQQDYANKLQNALAQQSISETTYGNLLSKLGLEKDYADTSWEQQFNEKTLAAQIAQQEAERALANAQFTWQQQQANANKAISKVQDNTGKVPVTLNGQIYYLSPNDYLYYAIQAAKAGGNAGSSIFD